MTMFRTAAAERTLSPAILIGKNGKRIFQLVPPLRHNNAALQQECAQMVDQRRALRH